MYVIIRAKKIKNGHKDEIIERFNEPSPIEQVPGFIKKELFYNDKFADYDLADTYIYFKDEASYLLWHTSDEHRQGHMHRNGQGRLEYVIEMTKKEFEIISSK